ncbi:tyrosine--tRNA ligase [Gloeobacter kilaueensis]|uniref:Tyrosine--tRNA ligase n=1 Tax=Gloeobacter kilaueensis (strain ATCC BAA-2537 / CCAP 1431/1 / ULC 316 / JS1) TaxID=1183438 RepID=U5QHP3_GLOK1|nr:tyrosine--tRNA ligase [Gloeobacter kilaueensis]AGY58441.1 tyrosyl-tRNA synthetase [Gloeobacter kilaueensis JS1]
MDQEQFQRLSEQGVAEIFPGGAQALAERLNTGKPLRVKLGIDPTRPDLHLGHAVVLRKLRQFQDLGHTAILLIGGFTAQIGDPTGKSETRPRLSADEVKANARTYLDQARLVLDFDRLEVRDNSEWLGGLDLSQIIRILASTSVAQMLAKEDFRQRYEQDTAIYLHEFLYPLLQGYDSVALDADIELGGTDQRFNLLMGRHLQALYGKAPQLALTVPLLVGLDGVKKMSKSLDNYVGFTEDPLTMYSKLEKTPDALVDTYFELLTDMPVQQLPATARERQKALALAITSLLHSPAQAVQAQKDAASLLFGSGAGENVPEVQLGSLVFPVRLAKILQLAGLTPSVSEGMRQIKNGAVRLDQQKVSDPQYEIAEAAAIQNAVLQVGKKQFRRLVVD